MNGDPTETFLLAPPREGRPAGHGLTSPPVMNFYSRPYARGDLKTGSRSGRSRPFLLTPLREGRHVTMMAKECVRYISTHAPARGATGSLLVPPACQPDFYSRPYARGDLCICQLCCTRILFLLAPLREGRRELQHGYLSTTLLISTRAPTRGATRRRPRQTSIL